MDLFKEFAVDEELVSRGVWRVFDKASDEIVTEDEIGDRPAVLLASTDNPKYQQALETKLKPHLMKRGIDVPKAVKEKAIAEALAEHVILNWKNWIVAGEHIDYSKGMVVKIWTELKWVRLKDRLLAMIGDVDAFKADREEAILGNS